MFIFTKKYFIISLTALILVSGTAESIFTTIVTSNYELCEESESSIEVNEFIAGRNKLTLKKVGAIKSTDSNSFLRSFQSPIRYPQKISLKEDKHILFRSLLI